LSVLGRTSDAVASRSELSCRQISTQRRDVVRHRCSKHQVEHSAFDDVLLDDGTGAQSNPCYQPAQRMRRYAHCRGSCGGVSDGDAETQRLVVRGEARRQETVGTTVPPRAHGLDEFLKECAPDHHHLGIRVTLQRPQGKRELHLTPSTELGSIPRRDV